VQIVVAAVVDVFVVVVVVVVCVNLVSCQKCFFVLEQRRSQWEQSQLWEKIKITKSFLIQT